MGIVGRETELELVRELLATTGSGMRALRLRGVAGIGKTAIWHAALDEAATSGFRVVTARPTVAEARLPFAGLIDLFGELLDEIDPRLPAPQRVALDLALLRAAADGPPAEPLAVGLGVLGLVRAAAAARPLAIAVDDLPWLDESTASVLEFVVRRLHTEPIALLLAERVEAPDAEPPSLIAALPSDRLLDIDVAPLRARETDRLLAETLGLELPPSELGILHRAAAGNPFFAVEIGRAIQRGGISLIRGELPLPAGLTGLLRQRLDALPAKAASVVATASALSAPTVSLLERACGADTMFGLAAAESAGVIAIEDGIVRFAHPLLAEEAYRGLGAEERRSLHRQLAAIVSEPEEHARHLALAADGPDQTIAGELDAAAEQASGRGAPDAAADLAERAVALTPADDARGRLRRQRAAARYRLFAGDVGRARELLEEALVEASGHDERAGILVDLGAVRQLKGDWLAADTLFSEAIGQATDPRLRIQGRLMLGGVSHITGHNWTDGARYVEEAMQLAEELGDPAVLARTVGPWATWRWITRGVTVPDLEDRIAALEPATVSLRSLDHPAFDLGIIQVARGDLEGYRRNLERLVTRAEQLGDYSSIAFLVGGLVFLDFIEGRADPIAERLDEIERLARSTDQRTALAFVLMVRTAVFGRTGQVEKARRNGQAASDLIAETGWIQGEPGVRAELALLELSRRDPAAAVAVLDARTSPSSAGHRGPVDTLGPLTIEALVGIGDHDAARERLTALENDPRLVGMTVLRAETMRAAALLEAATGDMDAAQGRIDEASAIWMATTDRWERARTLLVAGELHRRNRRRAQARVSIATALETFEGLGAELWAAEARRELGRIGGARGDRPGLTPTQRQVAELAMTGLTNRQVADRLFMSIHTVEAHLSAIYRKLGIRARTELAAALASGPRDSGAAVRDSDSPPPPET